MPDITGINSGSISKVSSFISSFARISIFYLNTSFLNKIFPKNFELARKGKKIKKKYSCFQTFTKETKNMLMFHTIYSPTLLGRFSTSVADPGCLSRIPDPDFYPSRIPDPGSRISDPGSRIPDLGSQIPDPKTATKKRGEKKFDVIPFYLATNFTKLYIILVLKC